ncbi:MAG: GNAT family N-acetyltransferase [Pseudomonadota bacterium]
MSAPTLVTERLVLRSPQLSDVAEHAAVWADPEVVRHIGGQVRDSQDAWFALLRGRALWDFLDYGYWIARERKSDAYVGEIGFADFKRDMVPTLSGDPEAGWVLAQSAWGKGFATEAVKAAHSWLDEVHPGRSTCIIDPDNTASIHVAEKAGYGEIALADYKGSPVIVFERYSPGTRKS